MKLTCQDQDQLTVMSLRGDFTDDQTAEFRKVATQKLTSKIHDFVLDVSSVEYVDSKGLESLLWLQDQCGEQLGQMRLAGVGEGVNKILEITRLTPRFECHTNVESAIKSLR